MNKRDHAFRFKGSTIVIIYSLIAVAIFSCLVVWWLLPKDALSITVTGSNGIILGKFYMKDEGDSLRYVLDSGRMKVYYGGEVHIFPMSAIGHIEMSRLGRAPE